MTDNKNSNDDDNEEKVESMQIDEVKEDNKKLELQANVNEGMPEEKEEVKVEQVVETMVKEEEEKQEEQEEEIMEGSSSSSVGIISNLLNTRGAEYVPEVQEDPELRLFREDDVHDMTWGRKLARHWSKKYKSKYDPSRNNPHTSLDAAWAYFEHSILPRHYATGSFQLVEPSSSSHSDLPITTTMTTTTPPTDLLKRAEYGELLEKTQLYNPITTPESELGDFGLSVAMYFWTLRMLAIIFFIAGILSVPAMIWFSNNSTSANGTVEFGLQGSAVCTQSSWVACPTCSVSDWDSILGGTTQSRFAYTTVTDDGSQPLTFLLKNHCTISYRQGMVAFVTLIVVCLSITIMNHVARKREKYIDSLSQTTSDYSIQISNPPKNAFDPDEWKEYFDKFFPKEVDETQQPVVAVTVALDNETLIRTLVERRIALQKLKRLLKPGVQFDAKNLERMAEQSLPVSTFAKHFCGQANASQLMDRIRHLEQKAQTWVQKRKCNVSHVFVSFDTEEAQRHVLSTLSVPGYQRYTGKITAIPDDLKFRGRRALQVYKPAEPSSIRWHDLDETLSVKLLQLFASFLLTMSAIVLGAIGVTLAGRSGPIWASITVTCINQLTPRICKFITNRFESHATDGNRQASLYLKMTIFKWVNTAVVTAIITPFVYTVEPGATRLLRKVYAIFFAELLTNPLLMISDLWGHFQRHILGPRAADQERMNLHFTGGSFLISLRYTEMTKILFLTFFYSAIYPAGFLFCAASLTINYFVDKFCLLRTYGPAPLVGNRVAEFSRTFIFPAALLSYAILLSYNYAGFPFDNACAATKTTTVPTEYIGTYTATTGSGDSVTISISPTDTPYSYCLQDFFRLNVFPAIPQFQNGNEWMTTDQERITRLLGWTSVVMVVLFFIRLLHAVVTPVVYPFFFRPTQKTTGGRMMTTTDTYDAMRFRNQSNDVYGYIPQVRHSRFQYPLLACDLRNVDPSFMDWSEPGSPYPYDHHNLIHDVALANVPSTKPVFSIIKTW